MAETTADAFATNSSNLPATSPNPVAVIPDASSNIRQIVVLGAGDGTNNIVDGTTANPINARTPAATVAVGQTTSNTSAVQLNSTSTPSTNGILVQAISTNSASVFIGGSGVTDSTGFELQAGQAVPFTVANLTSLYVIGANNTDKVCWNVL